MSEKPPRIRATNAEYEETRSARNEKVKATLDAKRSLETQAAEHQRSFSERPLDDREQDAAARMDKQVVRSELYENPAEDPVMQELIHNSTVANQQAFVKIYPEKAEDYSEVSPELQLIQEGAELKPHHIARKLHGASEPELGRISSVEPISTPDPWVGQALEKAVNSIQIGIPASSGRDLVVAGPIHDHSDVYLGPLNRRSEKEAAHEKTRAAKKKKQEYIDDLATAAEPEITDAEFEELPKEGENLSHEEIVSGTGNKDISQKVKDTKALTHEMKLEKDAEDVEKRANRVRAALTRDSEQLPAPIILKLEDQTPEARHKRRATEVWERIKRREETKEALRANFERAHNIDNTIILGDSSKKEPEKKPEGVLKAANDNEKKKWRDMSPTERFLTAGKWSAKTALVLGGSAVVIGGAGLLAGAAWGPPLAAGAGFGGVMGMMFSGLGYIASYAVLDGLIMRAFKEFFFNGGVQEWANDTFGFLGLKFGKGGGGGGAKKKGGGGHGGDHGHAANDNHGHGGGDHGHGDSHGAAAHH